MEGTAEVAPGDGEEPLAEPDISVRLRDRERGRERERDRKRECEKDGERSRREDRVNGEGGGREIR